MTGGFAWVDGLWLHLRVKHPVGIPAERLWNYVQLMFLEPGGFKSMPPLEQLTIKAHLARCLFKVRVEK